MPDFLHITLSDIDSKEKRGEYTVCILGCNLHGMILAAAFAEAGFKVIWADKDQSLIRRMKKRRSGFSQRNLEIKIKGFISSGMITATSDLKNAFMPSDAIILTVPAKIDKGRTSDFSSVEKNFKQIGEAMQRGVLVVYANVASLGFMENVVKETLERTSGFKTGQDFGLAYVAGFAETCTESICESEVIAAANDKASLDATQIIFSTVIDKGVKLTMNLKAAELAKLFSSAREEVTKALTNELSILCEKAQVDYYQTLNLVFDKQKSDHFLPGIDSQTSRIGTRILLENADNLGIKLRLTELGKQVNDDMIKHGVSLTREALRRLDKTFKRARIAVLGSQLNSSFEALVRILETRGARISLYESNGESHDRSDSLPASKRSIIEAVENSDCIVFLTNEDQFQRLNLKNLRSVMRLPAAVIDLARVFVPEDVESEGFLYASLGRGFEKQ